MNRERSRLMSDGCGYTTYAQVHTLPCTTTRTAAAAAMTLLSVWFYGKLDRLTTARTGHDRPPVVYLFRPARIILEHFERNNNNETNNNRVVRETCIWLVTTAQNCFCQTEHKLCAGIVCTRRFIRSHTIIDNTKCPNKSAPLRDCVFACDNNIISRIYVLGKRYKPRLPHSGSRIVVRAALGFHECDLGTRLNIQIMYISRERVYIDFTLFRNTIWASGL